MIMLAVLCCLTIGSECENEQERKKAQWVAEQFQLNYIPDEIATTTQDDQESEECGCCDWYPVQEIEV